MAIKEAVSKSARSTIKKPMTTAKKITNVRAARVNKKVPVLLGSVKRVTFIGALIAEFIGTFLLAAAVITGQGQPIIVLFAVVGIVLFVGTMSGAHLNPAVTLAAWVTRRINWVRALGYMLFQFLGASAAFGVLTTFVNGAAPVSQEAQAYGQTTAQLFQATALPVDKEWYVFFAELVGALILGFVVAGAVTVLRKTKDTVLPALLYGLGVFVALLIAMSAAAYVGGTAVVNPAVALSLEVVDWAKWWTIWPLAVYALAPAIGVVGGFLLHDLLEVKSDGGND